MQKHVMKLFSQPTADWFSDTFGMPTRVQEEAWAAIAKDKDVLVSAPTGTGKTLSAFLIFIDRLNALAAGGDLKEELYLLYVSPCLLYTSSAHTYRKWPGRLSGHSCRS